MNEFEVVGSPRELCTLDVEAHPSEEFDVEGRAIELLQFVKGPFEPVETPLRILKEIPPVRIRNEILGLPAPIDSVELGTLGSEDLWKDEKRHIRSG